MILEEERAAMGYRYCAGIPPAVGEWGSVVLGSACSLARLRESTSNTRERGRWKADATI